MAHNLKRRKSSIFTVLSDFYVQKNLENENTNKNEISKILIEKTLDKKIKQTNKNITPLAITEEKNEENSDNFYGAVYFFLSTFVLSLGHLMSKFFIIWYPTLEIVAANFLRGIILMLLSFYCLKREKMDYAHQVRKDKFKTFLLFIRCFFGSFCNITLMESFKYMRISSGFTIFCTYPIFTSIFSIFIFKNKYLISEFISYFACFVSVILISKPAFLFGDADFDKNDTAYGVFMAVVSAIMNGLGVCMNKPLADHFHYLLSSLFFGLCLFISSLIMVPFTDYGLSTMSLSNFVLITVWSGLYFIGLVLFVHALNIGDPIKILPIFYFGIVFSLIFNYFIFKKNVDFMDLLGSGMIIGFNVYNTVKVK